MSSWAARPLTRAQLQYAALDAHAAVLVRLSPVLSGQVVGASCGNVAQLLLQNRVSNLGMWRLDLATWSAWVTLGSGIVQIHAALSEHRVLDDRRQDAWAFDFRCR